MSLATKIIIGLLTGIAVGLFFGEYCSFLGIVGDGFIGLLQMTVLPYIMVSLIVNLGQMSLEEGKKLVFNGIKVLTILLLIGVIALVVIPLALPQWSASSFFKPSIIKIEEPLNFLDLYIPSNPFASMANNIVPAVVLFSIFLGIGISKIPGKRPLLQSLDVLGDGLNQINKMIVKITPHGVFAIAAYNAGTMSFDEIQRLHAYIIIYTVAVLLLGFYWLPLLVSSLTDIKPKELFKATKSTLLTIFATGKIIVVLPQLIDNVKSLINKEGASDNEINSKTEIMMPLAYPFPNLGTFVIFVFVPFTAWYMGSAFDLSENITFIGATLLSSFVAPVTGIPFLLDLLKLPQEMFQLFIISSVYTDRIRVVLGAIHLIVITVLSVKLTLGTTSIKWGKLIRGTVIGIVLSVVTLIGTNIYLGKVLGQSEQYKSFVEMQLSKDFERGKIKNTKDLLRDSTAYGYGSQLSLIKKRGVLRVGYLADFLPFAFKNTEGEMVGLDIEMAYLLAEELDVKLEFYKVNDRQMKRLLQDRKLDIVMSGKMKTTNAIMNTHFTNSYLNKTVSFIVPDYKRSEFIKKIEQDEPVKIATVNKYFKHKMKEYMESAEIVEYNSPRQYFKEKHEEVDALLFSAEAGSAWTVIYPTFNIVMPQKEYIQIPIAYPICKEVNWNTYINTWLDLKKKDGTIDILFEYWVEGQGIESDETRWSIVQNELGWLD